MSHEQHLKKSLSDLQIFRGFVQATFDGVCTIGGLNQHLSVGSVVDIILESGDASEDGGQNRMPCLVINLYDTGVAEAIILGPIHLIKENYVAIYYNKLLRIGLSLSMFGAILDGIGNIIATRKETRRSRRGIILDRIDKKASGIVDRDVVQTPLLTGITAIDSVIPIGRGQRQLIIGNRQTGKSSVSLDIILNYKDTNNDVLNTKGPCITNELTSKDLARVLWFVYCGIGLKQCSIASVSTLLHEKSADWYTCIVSATAAESPALQYLAPFTACSVNEYIRDVIGADSVVIFDDLSNHATAYRQMTLLLRRPPGREAFPGDIFYIHSRLLERAGSFCNKKFKRKVLVRGSITAFPIIETLAGDVSAYIPTNVISITDGQIFLDTNLFYNGVLPAIDLGLSVSRIGSAAQPELIKLLAGSLKVTLAQYREAEGFTKYGADINEHMQRLIFRGENIVEILRQELHEPNPTFYQVLELFLCMGYPRKYFEKIKEIGSKTRRTVTCYPQTNESWFDIIRSKTTVGASDVKLLLSNFYRFLAVYSIDDFFTTKSILDGMVMLAKKLPVFFIDDLFRLFILQKGSYSKVYKIKKNTKAVDQGSILTRKVKRRLSVAFRSDRPFTSCRNFFSLQKSLNVRITSGFDFNLYNYDSYEKKSCFKLPSFRRGLVFYDFKPTEFIPELNKDYFKGRHSILSHTLSSKYELGLRLKRVSGSRVNTEKPYKKFGVLEFIFKRLLHISFAGSLVSSVKQKLRTYFDFWSRSKRNRAFKRIVLKYKLLQPWKSKSRYSRHSRISKIFRRARRGAKRGSRPRFKRLSIEETYDGIIMPFYIAGGLWNLRFKKVFPSGTFRKPERETVQMQILRGHVKLSAKKCLKSKSKSERYKNNFSAFLMQPFRYFLEKDGLKKTLAAIRRSRRSASFLYFKSRRFLLGGELNADLF